MMTATLQLTMYATPSVFSRWVNIRKRLASGIQENLANGLADGLIGSAGAIKEKRDFITHMNRA
ncbi:MAG: hypothetical protein DMG35_04535 [Acidobacteria bacterium]|nr:MAG: hypothetical protein DMG35_04535 [Acidobacteriota bacterium]